MQYPAPAAPEDEGPPEHRGFFLRAALGVGYLVATSDPVSVSGVAVNLNIAPGFAIVENLILHGELNASVLPQPTLEGPGGVSISSPDVSFGTVHLGGGLTYFFPINFYISASAGFGVASLTDDASATRASTDPGFSFNSMVGKQFWVSQTITLGASGQFFYQRLPDGPGATFTLLGGGVSFSFTLH